MDRDPYGPGLVRDGPGNGLADPPGGIGTELIALPVFKFFHCLYESQIPLLDQIQELHPAAHIPFGDADHQTEVGLCQLLFCLLVAQLHAFCQLDLLLRGQQRHLSDLFQVHTHRILDPHALRHRKIQIFHIFFSGLFFCKQVRIHVVIRRYLKDIHLLIVQEVVNLVQLFRCQLFFGKYIEDLLLFQDILLLFCRFQELVQFLFKRKHLFFHNSHPSRRLDLIQ